ncbi:MAG: ribonuclease R [Thiohalophilus sp.]
MTERSDKHDPYAKREAEKYENPIPSREYIMELLEKTGHPMSREAIAETLELESDEQLEALRRRLRAMERDGQLLFNRKREYGLISKMDLVRGRVQGHPDGFGFLIPDDGSDDLFLSGREMRVAFHGDRVLARVAGIDRRGRREGAVVEVLERAHKTMVGRLFVEGGVAFVVPDNKRITQDILVPKENMGPAEQNQIVTVEIVQPPTPFRQAIGQVVEVLGEHMAPGMEIDIAIRSHGLPQVWSPQTEAQIAELREEVREEDKQGREDLRDLPLVTIDGEDARDFDDAVYCEPNRKGWRLLVAIADVSHYVEPETPLDKDAVERGNSVYFPERVIPMLPEILSNGLCSLKPKVDRLCMVCDMQLDKQGTLKSYSFYPAVMHSHARMTYNEVAGILQDEDPDLSRQYADLLPPLHNLYQLYHALRQRRSKRGAIDFETTETRIVFGEERKIESIVPTQRNDAHKLIEECMIIANVATARFLLENKVPALYRVHEGPKPEKLEALREFLGEFGLKLGGGDKPASKHFAKLLEQIAERPDAHLIQTVMLRTLQQAVYSPDNLGHFGLAFDAYAHFTSPIRRYPDLLVHRAIRHVLQHKKTGFFRRKKSGEFRYDHTAMARLGEHCSQTERRADEATRDAVDWLKCEFMLDKVGEEYTGTISSVTSFGLFVELDEVFVEGLVHVTSLENDYYHFDPAHHRLIGERQRQMFRLGDRLRVKLARVDLEERKMDFALLESLSGETFRGELPERQGGKKGAGGKKTARKKSSSGRKKTAGKKKSPGKKSTGKKAAGEPGKKSGKKSSRRRRRGGKKKTGAGKSPRAE